MRKQSGVVLLVVLLFVVLTTMAASAMVQIYQTETQREKEEQLLFVGLAYREAIRQYYLLTPGSVKRYPPDLASLLVDERSTILRWPLRKLYADPLLSFETNPQWGLVIAPGGGVMGVYSLAPGVPIKQAGFAPTLAAFAGASSYADWKFVYTTAGL